ncbi:SUMF1/EgtB/PvdO family nonheme iron enzyme [Melioribacteraceae bacterium 4301-Me]|uniref:SUMF1/EgtB/PvdO family nonheme iron enzyme n=1 Tax=Pyranulibacter aquaticus TaxID=3163344 RepID=UPI003598CC96
MRKNSSDYFLFAFVLIIICGFASTKAIAQKSNSFVNSTGIKMIYIPNGSFLMGEMNTTKPDSTMEYLTNGDYDEKPVHKVTITKPFYISETEITVEQYKKFKPGYVGVRKYYPYATGINWYDAVEFCKWLSKKEGKIYRLPTEAEWEYACKANSNTLYSTGDSLTDLPNAWGLKNLHNEIAEWCYDWYGLYPYKDQVDPVGPDTGFAKVVRGAGLDRQTPYYSRSANRASIAPTFPPMSNKEMLDLQKKNAFASVNQGKQEEKPQGFKDVNIYKNFYRDVLNNEGNSNIGFRIVLASMPKTKPIRVNKPYVFECVKQNKNLVDIGPSPDKPFFRKRYLLPIPPENTPIDKLKDISVTGLSSSFLRHNHSPALEVLPNGDVLAIYFSAVEEITPDVSLIAARLRFGADEWDMPSPFLDFADVDDTSPMLWRDNDTVRFYWGNNKLDSGFPFQWISSNDNGATWSQVYFPIFETPIGPHSAQPINTAFRDKAGNIYVACDGIGAKSELWVSKNNGKTWIDTGGRTAGRHTSFVLLKDGRILGMGGKSSNIDGYMPASISSDGGKTWKIEKTPFASLGSNQRPIIIRLKSGRLFMAGDFQDINGFQPKGITQRGSYVALSDDEGMTWHIKKLIGTQFHEEQDKAEKMHGETIGYTVARQAPNGNIHLITSMNEPCLHFEFNEAWILSSDSTTKIDIHQDNPPVTKINDVKEYIEKYPNGKLKAKWYAGIADNGRYLLHGKEVFYYSNGKVQKEAEYDKGKKIGTENYYDEKGRKLWSWKYNKDGTAIWTTYWENGNKKTESTWRDKRCIGNAYEWDVSGKLIRQVKFIDGVPQ